MNDGISVEAPRPVSEPKRNFPVLPNALANSDSHLRFTQGLFKVFPFISDDHKYLDPLFPDSQLGVVPVADVSREIMQSPNANILIQRLFDDARQTKAKDLLAMVAGNLPDADIDYERHRHQMNAYQELIRIFRANPSDESESLAGLRNLEQYVLAEQAEIAKHQEQSTST